MQPDAAKPSAFGVLRNPSFRSFTLAGMLWMMADNIEHVISYWVIHERFDSPVLGGYAVISHWAPFLLGGMFAGSLADRFDCRKLFLISMAMFMAVSLGWAFAFWTDTATVGHAVLFLTVHGIAGVIFSPASQLIIHEIVGSNHLASAVRLTATSRSMGILLGPAVGGFLLIALGEAAGMAVNALIYLPMVWWSLRQPYTGHGDVDDATRKSRPLSWSLGFAIETVREVSGNRAIMSMTVLAGLTSLLVGNAYQAQLPEFAEDFLGSDAGVIYTALLFAGAAGAIFGGLAQEALPSFSPSPVKATFLAAVWAATIIVFAAAPHYSVALVALFVSGVLLISFTSMAQALVQLEAPPDIRGRVVGLFNMSLNGLRIGSGVTVGFLGAVIGIHWSLGLSAAALVLATVPLFYYATGRTAATKTPIGAGKR
jgi:MFS family permease